MTAHMEIIKLNRLRWATLLIVASLHVLPHRALSQSAGDARPNIIVFLADDLGWRDLGAYGNRSVRTPNIDRLARAGLRVEQAFGTSPQCSPSRISMLTGRYPHTTRTEDLHTPFEGGERILPSLLQTQSYFTGHMAKTHYGREAERQFQWYSGIVADSFPAFLEAAGDRPFFLWVGLREPHRPYPDSVPRIHQPARVAVPPYLADTRDTRKDLARYYDAIAKMDAEIGRVLAELERRKLSENTLVLFLSDNGAPFPREKGTLYDAGTRTPLILTWPKVVTPGQVYGRGIVSTIDLPATLLEVAGSTSAETKRRSFAALLTNPAGYAGRDYVFSERNWHDCDEHQRAVRTSRFKLIRTDAYTDLPLCTAADIGSSPSFQALRARAKSGRLTAAQQRLFEAPRARLELYDVVADPWELRNVAEDPRYARELRELTAVLQKWMEQSDDFPAAFRVRDDNTDRITGLPFTTKIPLLRNTDLPQPDRRWGEQGPT
jgi:N-sulfoglucosamine sulfohydrolase